MAKLFDCDAFGKDVLTSHSETFRAQNAKRPSKYRKQKRETIIIHIKQKQNEFRSNR